MMHYSTLIYQTKKQKKTYAETKNPKKHVKSMGSYFEAPLIQKTLSTKPVAFRNVFRSIVEQYAAVEKKNQNHFLDLTPLQNTTMKTIYLQKLQTKNNSQLTKAFRRHYRIDIKQYLKRKYQKQAYQIPLQAFELLRLVNDQQTDKNWKTKFIYIYKPFFINDNLKRRIQSNNESTKQIFKAKNLPILFRQLLKCSVQFGGLDNFIMTTSNVYMQQNFQTLQINYTSFAGLGLLKSGSAIGAHQYFEVLPYFTQRMIQKKQIGVQDRIRFFLINCLCLMTMRDFTLSVDQPVEADKQFSFNQCKQKIKQRPKIRRQFQEQINGIKQKKAFEKIQIKQLLIRGLVKQQPITWHEIVTKICIGENYKKNQDEQPCPQYGKQIEQAFINFHKQLFDQDPDKDFYKARNIQSELLYIPIKYRADLNLIFGKKAWWDIFNIKSKKTKKQNPQFYNIFHENFCFRLLDVAIKKYQKAEINLEWAKKFESDRAIQILFEYLNVSELPCLIIKATEDPNQVNYQTFNKIYERYAKLKKKIKDLNL